MGDAKSREIGRRRSEIRTAKRSGFIVLTFLALWLPLPVAVAFSHLYVYRTQVDGYQAKNLQWHLDMQLGAFCVGMLTIVTNPIIYGLAIRTFWRAFKKMAKRDWERLRGERRQTFISSK